MPETDNNSVGPAKQLSTLVRGTGNQFQCFRKSLISETGDRWRRKGIPDPRKHEAAEA